jgi:hypothetical protein
MQIQTQRCRRHWYWFCRHSWRKWRKVERSGRDSRSRLCCYRCLSRIVSILFKRGLRWGKSIWVHFCFYLYRKVSSLHLNKWMFYLLRLSAVVNNSITECLLSDTERHPLEKTIGLWRIVGALRGETRDISKCRGISRISAESPQVPAIH